MCSHCGTGLKVGARWCPSCKRGTDDAAFIGPGETSGVTPVGPERVIDPTPLWGEGYGATRGIPERQRFVRHERSRWKKGVTTFGPGVKVTLTALYLAYLVWGWSNEFFILYMFWSGIGAWMMFLVWRKDDVDDRKAPLRESFRETGQSFTDSFRGGNTEPASEPAAGSARWICGPCGRPAVPGRAACVCGAPASMIASVEPEMPVVMEIKPPREVVRRPGRRRVATAARILATLALVAGIAVFRLVPEKLAVPMFPAYALVAGLLMWSMWHRFNRW